MRTKAILMILLMLIVPFSAVMTNPTLFGEPESDETSARSGPTHFQYYPTNQLTGSGALVNQTPAAYPLTNGAPILPMVLPPNPQIDGFYYSNNDFVIDATVQSKNWWTLNNETYSDTGTMSSTLELNGGAQWTHAGKNYGAIELAGNVGDNVTSTDCYNAGGSSGSSGFAGWFKPSSYDGQLFSQLSYQWSQGIDFDAFNVSMTPDGYIQARIYVDAENDTDFMWDDWDNPTHTHHDMDRVFNATTGMNTVIELNQWNYIAVEIDANNWVFDTRVYVNNGTSESWSSKMRTSIPIQMAATGNTHSTGVMVIVCLVKDLRAQSMN